ncbi:choice-of-anchor I family protein [Salinibius halmophilus]|uniref:choice-of-anchor I family protein n=1 Tax=Salinibius halmophilus TaxID=1853216 RepID=UPI0018F3FA80|nr:choice-of-anchor I family protein [Salinibius halmophilus]
MKKTLLALAISPVLLVGCQIAIQPTSPVQGNDNATAALKAELVGRATLGAGASEGAAEIVQFHTASQRILAINSSGPQPVVEIIPATEFNTGALTADAEGVVNNANLASENSIDLRADNPALSDANSIAVHGDLLAVAMAGAQHADDGAVMFYQLAMQNGVLTASYIKSVTAGNLPDMVTFNETGTKVVVANEGEPSGDYTFDPEGSVSVIDVVNGVPADTATQVNFRAFNGLQAELEAQGMYFASPEQRVINGQSVFPSTVAQDLEPEYVTVKGDTAWVALQENNGFAIVNLNDYSVRIVGLGLKDWGQYDMDAYEDGQVGFARYPGIVGMYQPDTIAAYTVNGQTYVVTANEGDSREYFFPATDAADCQAKGGLEFSTKDGCLAFIDEAKASALAANIEDPALAAAANGGTLNKLLVSQLRGDNDGDGKYEQLFAYGARSFSIFDASGNLVFDSGDQLEKISAEKHGNAFNNDEDANAGDSRSANKGPEPEALALGEVDGRTYAFVGTERMGTIFVYDITDPANVSYVNYLYNRGLVEGASITGDMAPEGMKFVPAADSATGKAQLIVGNEISGSVSVWQFN